MSRLTTSKRRLVPGTTGWTADDLDDPRIAAQWEAGRFQMFEGVLAIVPPAYFDTSAPLTRLVVAVQTYLNERGSKDTFAFEVDLELSNLRIPRADAVCMSADDKEKQVGRRRPKTPKQLKYGRLRVPPTLVVESISKGHESEARDVKRAYYEQAQIPNYWIIDAFQKSLECLRLVEGRYVIDQIGRGTATLQPTCFPGLVIELAKIWDI